MEDHSPPDPDRIIYPDPMDDQSMNDDMAVASGLTGRSKTPTPTTRQQSSLQRVTISQEALLGSPWTPSGPLEKTRKRTRFSAPSPSTLDEVDEITGTPRSTRIAKLFPGGSDVTAKPLTVLIKRLIEATRATLIPKTKASKSVKVDVDSAAEILLLGGLIQEQASINEARRVVFEPGRQTAPNPSSSPSSQFDFRVSTISEKMDMVVEQLAKLGQAPRNPRAANQTPPSKSYALAASKHAPSAANAAPQTDPARSKPSARAKTSGIPRSDHSITLNQHNPANIAGSERSIPDLIKYLNTQLKACKIRVKPDDLTEIEVRNIHRRPSGDLVLYLDNAKQAQAMRSQAETWLPRISSNLSVKQEVYSVIVHGVPTTFNPTRQDDIDLLKTCNGSLLDDATLIRWLRKDMSEDASKRHSSLLISLTTLAQATLAARTKVWQGRGCHRTELSGPPPTRCYNCHGTGHTAAACGLPPMCPTCAGPHLAHSCPAKGSLPLKCTACARSMLNLDPQANLPRLFKDNHPGFLHHPFAAVCSTRIGNQTPHQTHQASQRLIIADSTSLSQC